MMKKRTLPWPSGGLLSGGRNPSGELVDSGCPVAGSIEERRHVSSPVLLSSLALMRTIRFFAGRRSTSLLNSLTLDGDSTRLFPNEIEPKLKLLRLNFDVSS